ncbi:helix-turn-helix domain-containing protein [Pedobacter sp. KACC 23697]|uniref:Helix-turn-helix transcriptional regulator n=1 Tax=Pedobacter sp. KACC 23697 TaxID=3149230 RepID=A0AAU7KBI6_9SPHI
MEKNLLKTTILKPENIVLKQYIEYFLFLHKKDGVPVQYTTFPNNNLCLAIYRHNHVDYQHDEKVNHCLIKAGRQEFTSRIYGFHNMPFQVDIQQELDQICVIFYPAALKAFTRLDFDEMHCTDQVFEQLFKPKDKYFLEKLFEEPHPTQQARQLERLLLDQLEEHRVSKIQEALYYLSIAHTDNQNISVEMLCEKLGCSDTTLFRLFKTSLGQNPQKYLKTFRFRKALKDLMTTPDLLTTVALRHHYYDQAHFIKDFKTFTGYSPKKLLHAVSVQQQSLAWIYQEKSGE